MHDDHDDYVCTDIIAGISNDEEIYAKEVFEDERGSVLVENRGADLC